MFERQNEPQARDSLPGRPPRIRPVRAAGVICLPRSTPVDRSQLQGASRSCHLFDTDGKRDTVTRYGFLIEPVKAGGAETVGKLCASWGSPADRRSSIVALVQVFQYMIGNPDWSLFSIEPGEDACCHNTVRSVPVRARSFQFRMTSHLGHREHALCGSALCSAERNMGIRSVRQRAFAVSVRQQPRISGVLRLFNRTRRDLRPLSRAPRDERRGCERDGGVSGRVLQRVNDPRKLSGSSRRGALYEAQATDQLGHRRTRSVPHGSGPKPPPEARQRDDSER